MKILYTAFDVYPAPKGAGTRISHMLQALAQRHEVQGIFLGEPGYARHEMLHGIKMIRLIEPALSFLERAVQFGDQVLAQIHHWQPDVVHCRSLWDAYPVLIYRQRTQQPFLFVFEANGLPRYELEHHFRQFPPALLDKIHQQENHVIQQADWLICPSIVNRDCLLQLGAQAEKIEVIPNGADIECFQTGLPLASPPLILYLGTLAPWQGLEDLLSALQGIRSPFQARLIGKGNHRWQTDLITRIYQLGLSHAVSVSGAVPHDLIPRILAEATVTVAPLDNSLRNTVQGCQPIKILEYMASGKPVVAPDLPVIHALISHQQEGLLYPVGDTLALRACLEQVLHQPETGNTMGQRGRQKVSQHFQWQHAQVRLLTLYDKVETEGFAQKRTGVLAWPPHAQL